MASFSNPKEVLQFIEERAQAALPMRRELAWKQGLAMCAHEGIGWITQTFRGVTRGVDRLKTDFDPDSNNLRVTNNITAKSIQKIAARTWPDDFFIDVFPPERDSSSRGYFEAGVHENLIRAFLEDARLVRMAQIANFRRCVGGTWGLGLAIENGVRSVRGQAMPDKRIRAFEFNTSNLVLDPGNQSIDLEDHEEVAYTDVWTADALEATFGITLDRDKLSTIEQLEPIGEKLSTLSERRLFSKHARYSQTKGARFFQLHCKDETGTFGKWYLVIETGKEDRQLVNEDVATPFGGSGMPFTMLHGHLRGDSMWSWGEADQISDEQKKLNSIESMFFRIVRKHSGFQWLADRRFFGDKAGKDDIARNELNNQIGGIVLGNAQGRNSGIQFPQLVQPPSPPAFLQQMMDRYPLEAREKIHTSEGSYGKVPTHVPTDNFQRAMDAADQVADVRGQNDLRAYKYITSVLHGTAIKLAQERVPGVLATLSLAEFDEQDFAVVATADPVHPRVQIDLRPGTVHKRSFQARKQDLDFALTNHAISGAQYTRALGDSLDSPLTDDMRQMLMEARKWSLNIIAGEQWDVAIQLGEWSDVFINEFIRAQFDRNAKLDPAARQRLAMAIQAIKTQQAQDALMADPALQAKMATDQAAAEAEAAQAGPTNENASVADVLQSLTGGGSPDAGRQPAAVS